MNTSRSNQFSYYWIIALKLLILALGLYISFLVLGKIFTWVFAVAFFLIRIVVLLIVSFIVLHFLLKLLFEFDLYKFVMDKLP
jgi:fatty acid desaturase